MKRRTFVGSLAVTALGLAGWRWWPESGIWRDCSAGSLPGELLTHLLVRQAWDGLDPARVWDGHVHLLGYGHGGTGAWVNPAIRQLSHPIQYLQRSFYLNAGCVEDEDNRVDQVYLDRLRGALSVFPVGARAMLLAFDYFYDREGRRDPGRSSFYVPDDYCRKLSQLYPDRFVWAASIHPYRRDCVEALDRAVAGGARAVKWLPPAMGMDPASPLCDRFYAAAARHRIPVLVHADRELAVFGADSADYGNPLRLRRALQAGVRVIVAHCATFGRSPDLDRGPDGPRISNFELFARLMDEPAWRGQLYGDLSAVAQINRLGPSLITLLKRQDWHDRLINGSDYPLPAVMPLFSLKAIVRRGLLHRDTAEVINRVRLHNPLLFDFLLKRHLRFRGQGFADEAFHSRDRLQRPV